MRSPSPPPLRTVRAPFNAYGSSIEQRLCGARPGTAPPAHDTPNETRSPHWPWGQPGPYYGRAGDRRSAGAAPRALPPATDLLCPLGRLAVGSGPSTPGGSQLAFARGDSQPLSGPLQAGLRFLPRPLPAAPSARLTAGLPSREDGGLTTLHHEDLHGLGPAFTPVARHLRRVRVKHPDLATYRFGPSLSAPLACSCSRRLRRFTWVGHTMRPWSQTAAVLAVATSVRTPVAIPKDMGTLFRGLRTPLLPGTHASVGDCWQNSRCYHLLIEE